MATSGGRSSQYVPERGHAVWLDFDDGRGHEQGGRRPALVLTPKRYNEVVGNMVVCAISRQVKGYPFEVALPETSRVVRGAILVDQIRTVDYNARRVDFMGLVPVETMREVDKKLRALLTL